MPAETELREGNKVLKERGSVYGPYGNGVKIRSAIMRALLNGYRSVHGHNAEIDEMYKQYFWDIANKLCRLAVTPDHLDSWHDLGNYAHLIEADIKDNGDKNVLQAQSQHEMG